MNTVTYDYVGDAPILSGEFQKRYIYALCHDGIPIYVGDTSDPEKCALNHRDDILNPDREGTGNTKFMRVLLKLGNVHFSFEILETIDVLENEDGANPTEASKIAEQKWIADFGSLGHVISNCAPKIIKEPKPPKEPKDGVSIGKEGGWQITAESFGQGLKIKCKYPLDGSFWECDHDALANIVNESLKAKGKTLLGEPGPSQKQYGASRGLRAKHLWNRLA